MLNVPAGYKAVVNWVRERMVQEIYARIRLAAVTGAVQNMTAGNATMEGNAT
jgi:hypothetical protein